MGRLMKGAEMFMQLVQRRPEEVHAGSWYTSHRVQAVTPCVVSRYDGKGPTTSCFPVAIRLPQPDVLPASLEYIEAKDSYMETSTGGNGSCNCCTIQVLVGW